MEEDEPLLIDGNVQCIHCGYNLRGLDHKGVCPECAMPVWFAIRSKGKRYSEPILRAAKSAESTSNACMLLMRSMKHALIIRDAVMHKPVAMGEEVAIPASELCEAMREIVGELIQDEEPTKKFLTSIKLTCSEDVGRLMAAMIREKLFEMTDTEGEEKFRGLFTLDNFFAP